VKRPRMVGGIYDFKNSETTLLIYIQKFEAIQKYDHTYLGKEGVIREPRLS